MTPFHEIKKVPRIKAIGMRGDMSLWDVDTAFNRLYEKAMSVPGPCGPPARRSQALKYPQSLSCCHPMLPNGIIITEHSDHSSTKIPFGNYCAAIQGDFRGRCSGLARVRCSTSTSRPSSA